MFGVTVVGVCAGNNPSTVLSHLCDTAFTSSWLCPGHLTLDEPFCSVGDYGEEESGRFQMKLILMSVR